MKISKIEFQNFRNFKDRCSIKCSTDGKVTIIYGLNGDGKTTLHQLFQWIFYDEIHFNKTANDKLYNLVYERELDYGEEFSVWGSIDFECNDEFYSLRREWIYKKELNDSRKVSEDLSLMKKDSSNNWNTVDHPEIIIDEILPPGLAEYFFFDGESMLADLRVKGRDSANKLKRALYSMFDLDIYEEAVNHIGSSDRKTTVLGHLFLSKTSTNDTETKGMKANIDNTQNKIDSLEKSLEEMRQEKSDKEDFIKSASEEIGGTLSKKHYEQRRTDLKKQRDDILKNLDFAKSDFGQVVIKEVPKIFAAKALRYNAHKIDMECEKNRLIPGVKPRLIESLLKADTCICGRPLSEKEYDYLQNYRNLLPPRSYVDSYSSFENTLSYFENGYEVAEFYTPIKRSLDYLEQAQGCDSDISKVDAAEKNSDSGVQQLIEDRQAAEDRVSFLTIKIEENASQLKIYQAHLRSLMKKFEQQTESAGQNEVINRKIALMESVRGQFERTLQESATEYSEKLQEQIQLMLNEMLTSKRNVSVTPDFLLECLTAMMMSRSPKDNSQLFRSHILVVYLNFYKL